MTACEEDNDDGHVNGAVYVSGYMACLYLADLGYRELEGSGAVAFDENGEIESISAEKLREGLGVVLSGLHEGDTLDEVINRLSGGVYADTKDFTARFIKGTYDEEAQAYAGPPTAGGTASMRSWRSLRAGTKTEADEMKTNQRQWVEAKNALVQAVEELGFPAALGEAAARHLGSPKAIERMTAYLGYAKPKSEELIVDEMLAIRSEIDAWKEKKASEKANARYNEMLYYGLGTEEKYDKGSDPVS